MRLTIKKLAVEYGADITYIQWYTPRGGRVWHKRLYHARIAEKKVVNDARNLSEVKIALDMYLQSTQKGETK